MIRGNHEKRDKNTKDHCYDENEGIAITTLMALIEALISDKKK